MNLPPFIDDFTYNHNRAVDGDTVEGWLSFSLDIPDWTITIKTPVLEPIRLRLVTLDTPERGEIGWANARADAQTWLTAQDRLRAQTYGQDAFGRLLADLYVADDRQDTLTQHMLRERGWKPWVPR